MKYTYIFIVVCVYVCLQVCRSTWMSQILGEGQRTIFKSQFSCLTMDSGSLFSQGVLEIKLRSSDLHSKLFHPLIYLTGLTHVILKHLLHICTHVATVIQESSLSKEFKDIIYLPVRCLTWVWQKYNDLPGGEHQVAHADWQQDQICD